MKRILGTNLLDASLVLAASLTSCNNTKTGQRAENPATTPSTESIATGRQSEHPFDKLGPVAFEGGILKGNSLEVKLFPFSLVTLAV